MYLKNLKLEGFRSFLSSEIHFQKELTILVGENNCGKSNAIDAIRLLTPALNGRREIYCQTTDIRFGHSGGIELAANYANLNDAQGGRLISACADKNMSSASFGLSFDETKGGYPPRPSIWAGQPGRVPEAGSHDLIRHVYLPALRDAKHALASGNPTRIYALLKHFLGEDESEELVAALSRKAEHGILTKIGTSVDTGLEALTGGVRQQAASLGFARDEKLIDIARDLRFSLSDHGIEPEDLSYSGHGYANLLYMATIAVELENVSNADLTLFLVEEPEAHLHPQLQAAVLSFLRERSQKSREEEKPDGGFAGELQVIVATHSPNLTASVPSENLVFLRSANFDDGENSQEKAGAEVVAEEPVVVLEQVTEGGPAEDGSASTIDKKAKRPESRALALASLLPEGKERRKIDRYLDVTKASFLFGGRVLLVEGIAEALLLPVLAERIVLKGDEPALRRFRSATYVPIDGVDFLPYIKLLASSGNGIRIADKVVVVTDGDGPKTLENGLIAGVNRKRLYDAFAAEQNASDICQVFVNDYSLEAELLAAGNEAIMKEAYIELHSQSGDKWEAAVAGDADEVAKQMHELFQDTRKGDFAQILAQAIEDGEGAEKKHEFAVPQYLVDAIKATVE